MCCLDILKLQIFRYHHLHHLFFDHLDGFLHVFIEKVFFQTERRSLSDFAVRNAAELTGYADVYCLYSVAFRKCNFFQRG